MPVYRKGDDQFDLWQRAKQQEDQHQKTEADRGGYMIGLNENMTIDEYKATGGGPVSAKGMRMGQAALESQRRNPDLWKNAGWVLADERRPPKGK